jgi:hypothetical protein
MEGKLVVIDCEDDSDDDLERDAKNSDIDLEMEALFM